MPSRSKWVLMPLRAFVLFGRIVQAPCNQQATQYVLMPLRAFVLFGRGMVGLNRCGTLFAF